MLDILKYYDVTYMRKGGQYPGLQLLTWWEIIIAFLKIVCLYSKITCLVISGNNF